jgi:tRNA pseudouridine13 synthase
MNRKPIGIEIDDNNRPPAYIKDSNNDFIVCEVTKKGVMPLLRESVIGDNSCSDSYKLFNLTKNGYTTQDAILEISNQFGIAKEAISYHGMKDKNALTCQLIAIPTELLTQGHSFNNRNIFLQGVGSTSAPLLKGGNEGNFFHIRLVTNDKWTDLKKINNVYNFFGHQRFGAFMDEQNIGRFLLMGLHKDAASKISFYKQKILFKKALSLCGNDYEQAFLHPTFIQSTRFAIQQWQSYLFNKLLSRYIKLGIEIPDQLPLWNTRRRKIYDSVWGYCGKINHEMIKLASGTIRKTKYSPQKLNFSSDNKSITLQFKIPSGCYATTVLEQLFDIKEKRYE